MRKPWFIGIIVCLVLLTLITSPGLAQKTQTDEGMVDPTGSDMGIEAVAPSWAISWVDSSTSANVGTYPSVTYNSVEGVPYISYYDAVNGDLVLAKPVSPSGSGNCGTGNNWQCLPLDTFGTVGLYSSIDFWSGTIGQSTGWKLGITYYDATNKALKYAERTQIGAAGSWTYMTIMSGSATLDVGKYSSLKFNSYGSANAAFQYIDGSKGYMMLGSYAGGGGNCGEGIYDNTWSCSGIDEGTPLMGKYISLDLDYANQPFVSYYDGDNANLKMIEYAGYNAGNCGIFAFYNCMTIDSAGDVGLFTSITAPQLFGDIPRIAYYDKTNGNLKYAIPHDPAGANCAGGQWFCGSVDTIGAGYSSLGISMALDRRGFPVIAYMEAIDEMSPSKLKVARPAAAVGAASGNCGQAMPGTATPFWKCEMLDNASYGAGYVNVAGYTAIAVGPHGQITIPYLESDDYSSRNNVKIAQVLPAFADVPFSYWAHDFIDIFYYNGITGGCGGPPLIYCPERNVTRAEMAVFMLRAKNGLVTPTPAPSGMFADVPVAGKEWMKPWIEEFYNEGITTGCGSSPLIYCPERNVTRAEMAVFILRAIHTPGWTPPAVVSSSFADVPVTGKTWMMPWIEAYYDAGYTTGCGYNASHQLIFCPERNVTRAEMAVFIDRAFEIK